MARPRRRRPLPYGPQFGIGADGKPTIRPNANDPIAKATGQAPVLGNREVIRRQRLLKAKGYKLTVDGRWGPISRRFWTQTAALNDADEIAGTVPRTRTRFACLPAIV